MLRSVRAWLLKICHTDGPHTLGEMVSHTGDPHIPVIMVCHADGPHASGNLKQSAIQARGSPFSPRDPHIPGKMGTQAPHFRGSLFSYNTGNIYFLFASTVSGEICFPCNCTP